MLRSGGNVDATPANSQKPRSRIDSGIASTALNSYVYDTNDVAFLSPFTNELRSLEVASLSSSDDDAPLLDESMLKNAPTVKDWQAADAGYRWPAAVGGLLVPEWEVTIEAKEPWKEQRPLERIDDHCPWSVNDALSAYQEKDIMGEDADAHLAFIGEQEQAAKDVNQFNDAFWDNVLNDTKIRHYTWSAFGKAFTAPQKTLVMDRPLDQNLVHFCQRVLSKDILYVSVGLTNSHVLWNATQSRLVLIQPSPLTESSFDSLLMRQAMERALDQGSLWCRLETLTMVMQQSAPVVGKIGVAFACALSTFLSNARHDVLESAEKHGGILSALHSSHSLTNLLYFLASFLELTASECSWFQKVIYQKDTSCIPTSLCKDKLLTRLFQFVLRPPFAEREIQAFLWCLFQETYLPFEQILKNLLSEGALDDVYNEFFIVKNSDEFLNDASIDAPECFTSEIREQIAQIANYSKLGQMKLSLPILFPVTEPWSEQFQQLDDFANVLDEMETQFIKQQLALERERQQHWDHLQMSRWNERLARLQKSVEERWALQRERQEKQLQWKLALDKQISTKKSLLPEKERTLDGKDEKKDFLSLAKKNILEEHQKRVNLTENKMKHLIWRLKRLQIIIQRLTGRKSIALDEPVFDKSTEIESEEKLENKMSKVKAVLATQEVVPSENEVESEQLDVVKDSDLDSKDLSETFVETHESSDNEIESFSIKEPESIEISSSFLPPSPPLTPVQPENRFMKMIQSTLLQDTSLVVSYTDTLYYLRTCLHLQQQHLQRHLSEKKFILFKVLSLMGQIFLQLDSLFSIRVNDSLCSFVEDCLNQHFIPKEALTTQLRHALVITRFLKEEQDVLIERLDFRIQANEFNEDWLLDEALLPEWRSLRSIQCFVLVDKEPLLKLILTESLQNAISLLLKWKIFVALIVKTLQRRLQIAPLRERLTIFVSLKIWSSFQDHLQYFACRVHWIRLLEQLKLASTLDKMIQLVQETLEEMHRAALLLKSDAPLRKILIAIATLALKDSSKSWPTLVEQRTLAVKLLKTVLEKRDAKGFWFIGSDARGKMAQETRSAWYALLSHWDS